jgi:hypothetical protein
MRADYSGYPGYSARSDTFERVVQSVAAGRNAYEQQLSALL